MDLVEILQVFQSLNQTLELVMPHQNRTRIAMMRDVERLPSLTDIV